MPGTIENRRDWKLVPRSPTEKLVLALMVVLLSRWISMAFLPFTDTTEARYANIARGMAISGDWITPWFEPGLPFWGKPPLSFWIQAVSYKVLGWDEFALRFPAWLAQLGMVWLVWRYASSLVSRQSALITSLIFASSSLAYVLAGAVMTDPFLGLGTTAGLTGAALALRGEGLVWGWVCFLGLAVGLLAKGPLTFVLVGGPLFLWLLWTHRWSDLRRLPVVGGTIVMLLMTAPWYLLAELKTPGFIDYFLVGEHIKRFLDPGWVGDIYGSAHDEVRGTIWLLTLYATLPWSPLALSGLFLLLRNDDWGFGAIRRGLSDDDNKLLLLAAFMPSLFFTFSGNILASYVLPGLPFMALLMVRGMQSSGVTSRWLDLYLWPFALFVPTLSLVAGAWIYLHPGSIKTEKGLIACYYRQPENGAAPLIYLDDAPFSARYYSQEKVREKSLDLILREVKNSPGRSLYVAVQPDDLDRFKRQLSAPFVKIFENRRYVLMTQSDRAVVTCR